MRARLIIVLCLLCRALATMADEPESSLDALALAARYGHRFAAAGESRDQFRLRVRGGPRDAQSLEEVVADALAGRGLRYTDFHTTSMCSTT